MFKSFNRKDWFSLIIIVGLNILPRLVYFLNKGFFIDGDEAILGSMVNDFVKNSQVPLFFTGQNYCFVFFEVLLAGIISFLFGTNIFTLKIAMLIFWLASMIFLYFLSKKLLASRNWALLSVLLVSSIPAWFDWASKARGGYLTALLLSLIVMLLFFCKRNLLRILIVSISLVFIYYSQPLWLVVVFPFIFYYFFRRFNLRQAFIFVGGLLSTFSALEIFFRAIGFRYQTYNRLGFGYVGENIRNLVNNLFIAHSGQFFDVVAMNINLYLTICSSIFIILLFLSIVYNFYLLFIRRIKTSSLLFLSSVLLYFVFMLFYNESEFSYRYLLPVFLPGMMLIILSIKNFFKSNKHEYLKILLIVYVVFSFVCSAFSYNYLFVKPNDNYSEVERILFLKSYLEDNQIDCVYTMDWMISQYFRYFISDISSRNKNYDLRYRADDVLVDQMHRRGSRCALIGFWYQMPSFASIYNLRDIMVVGGRYVVYLSPKNDDLLQLGFELTP